MAKWVYKGDTPLGGKKYHKKRQIMIIYNNVVKMYYIPVGKPMLPTFCTHYYQRIRNYKKNNYEL